MHDRGHVSQVDVLAEAPEMITGQKMLALKLKVRPLQQNCVGCLLRGRELCTWCASLCEDEAGTVYVGQRPFSANDSRRRPWRWRRIEDLAVPPRRLLLELDLPT